MKSHDELSNLYQTDPEQFEVEAREMIEKFISSCPPERQLSLRQLQWKIDNTLSKYKNPTARMNKMVEMFWEGVSTFCETINGNISQL